MQTDIITNQETLRRGRLKRVRQRHGYSERQIRRMTNDPNHLRKIMKEIAELRR